MASVYLTAKDVEVIETVAHAVREFGKESDIKGKIIKNIPESYDIKAGIMSKPLRKWIKMFNYFEWVGAAALMGEDPNIADTIYLRVMGEL